MTLCLILGDNNKYRVEVNLMSNIAGLNRKLVTKVSQLTGMSSVEAKELLTALDRFTTADFHKIRKADREGKNEENIKILNKFMHKMPPYAGNIYRGMSFSEKSIKPFIQQLKPHEDYTLDSVTSFTSDPKIAETYSGHCYQVVIRVKHNHSGVSISDFSAMYSEREVLVPKGTKYEVMNVPKEVKHGQINYIDLEEVEIAEESFEQN
ncbi:MAG: ADP-ribosyltransferase [Microcoleaceae cyanobacterium MO_207.B10]|nr:ADP-ribosyltransferase [Microcoleaceae cyanobacterium MO_207.B10]